MLSRLSLLDELRQGGYEASLIATYNAYLPFYEEVVLRRLVGAGVRHNCVLMDASQYSVSVATHPPRLAGRQYTLIPIRVPAAFHPKLILLLGKDKALVIIGSHNLTLAGFGFNRELTNVIRARSADDTSAASFVSAVWSEVAGWLTSYTSDVPERVRQSVRRMHEVAPWLSAKSPIDDELKLLAGRPGAISLWEQLKSLIQGEVHDISMCGPFFDQSFEFLERVRRDYGRASIAVGVDPDTVRMSTNTKSLQRARFVRADQLGAAREGSSAAGYLHAKSILLRGGKGEAVFASGSANPSAPAWLQDDATGNVELMIARRGKPAVEAAAALGISKIPDYPELDRADWRRVTLAQSLPFETSPPGYRTGLALVDDDRVYVALDLLQGLTKVTYVLRSADGKEIGRLTTCERDSGFVILAFASIDLANAATLEVLARDTLVAKFILHHARMVEEESRTGVQRRFREALASLDAATPDFELLVHCLERMAFSGDRVPSPAFKSRAIGEPTQTNANALNPPTTLAIDVSEIKRRNVKKRLIHSGDLAYLLDVLIYNLRSHEDKSIEEIDRSGRTEEEQVGVEGDDEDDSNGKSAQTQAAVLDLCHAKVSTIVSRTISHLEACSAGKEPISGALVGLLAVLAVLRELRNRDGRSAWVERGQTAVPLEQRRRLLEGIAFNLFERNSLQAKSSLLHLESLGEDYFDSDDIARLKGLILWLAWDSGVRFELTRPFNESAEAFRQRLRDNAICLALAQAISNDIAIEEARQSIGVLAAGDMEWLEDVRNLAGTCRKIREGKLQSRDADTAEAGDIAFHRELKDLDLRIVASNAGSKLLLVHFAKEKVTIGFTLEALAVVPMRQTA